MSLDFPNPTGQTPANTFSPTSTPSASTNGITYTWDGSKWNAEGTGGSGVTPDLQAVTDEGNTTTNDIITSGDIQSTSLNGGPLAGFRNQIINGDFRVWQRGTSVTQGPALNGYGADRWGNVFNNSGNTLTYTRVTDHGFANHAYACRFTSTTDLTNARVRQAIELDAEGSAGKFTGQWTLSWTSSAQPQFVLVAFADDFENRNASSGWTQDAAGIVSLGNDRYSVTFTADATPNATNTCALLTFAPPAGAGPWDLTGVQLEPGPVATPFEHRPIGTELALCQRYYETQAGIIHSMYQVNQQDTSRSCYVQFATAKRATPTFSPTINGGLAPTINANVNGVRVNSVVNDTSSGISVTSWSADAEL